MSLGIGDAIACVGALDRITRSGDSLTWSVYSLSNGNGAFRGRTVQIPVVQQDHTVYNHI